MTEPHDSEHDRLIERLEQAVRASGKPKLTIEREAGVGRGQLSHILSGGRPNVSLDVVVKLAGALRVDIGWLATGEGAGPSATEPFPNRSHAFPVFREEAAELGYPKAMVERAIQQVRSIVPPGGQDRTIRAWVAQAHAAYADVAMRASVGRTEVAQPEPIGRVRKVRQ